MQYRTARQGQQRLAKISRLASRSLSRKSSSNRRTTREVTMSNVNLRALMAALLATALTAPLMAGEATEGIKQTTEEMLAVLKDSASWGPGKTPERRKKIREAADERFDWHEISRRCLARHWIELNEQQQKEFVDLFVRFIESSYMGNIETHYTDLKEIEYLDEKIRGKYAAVVTKVKTTKDTEHPVEFRMKAKDGWKIFDMLIEGVSMVKNYRTQFDELIRKSGHDGLVKKIEEKIKEGLREAEKEQNEAEEKDAAKGDE